MYEELFQTPDRPFRATPDVRFYFAYDSIEQSRQTVLRVVRRAEGPAAVMGSVGLGKSLLAQLLADDLKDAFDVVRLHAARLCSRRAMLQSILFELKLPYRELSEGELRLSLMERLEPSAEHAPEGLVLIVDEAQTLPTKLLEELRLITNFARHGQARARLVLLGGMHLEETFALPEMSSFNQRLAARCFLQAMNRQQTADFVGHQFSSAGVDPKQIITRDALENVYVASEGIPRLANQVMDHALILAIANDQYPISAALIQEAWSDLQQLPMGWSQSQPAASPPVEFGSIDDLDQDFELEPEGADDLDVQPVSAMHWPAPSDLEDFGPAGLSTETARTGPESHAVRGAAAPSRVVFDASRMFETQSQPLSITPVRAAQGIPSTLQPTPYSAAEQKTRAPFNSEDTDHDLFLFQEDNEPTTHAAAQSTENHYTLWSRSGNAPGIQVDLDHQLTDGMTEFEIDLPIEALSNAVPMPLKRLTLPSASDPFGQDFDEEFAVDASDVRRWQERQAARRLALAAQAAQTAAQEALAVQKSIAAKANVTARNAAQPDAPVRVTMHAQPAPEPLEHPKQQPSLSFIPTQYETSESADHTLPAHAAIASPSALEGSFTSNFVGLTNNGDIDERLQQEIEDLISQLNFSAFSVETDSVEQISPDFARTASSASQHLPEERGPNGVDYSSYPLRADEQASSIEMANFDDRDLLIIDEDIPSSVRHNHMPVMAPTTGTMNYPQLFQQLRG